MESVYELYIEFMIAWLKIYHREIVIFEIILYIVIILFKKYFPILFFYILIFK